MKLTTKALLWSSLSSLLACNQADKSDESAQTDELEIAEVAPEDTQGGTGEVSIGFATGTGAALWLDDETPPSLAINDNVKLTLAKFNIAAIKLKAVKDPSTKETEVEKKEVEEEAEQAAAVDALDEEAQSLHGKDDHGDQGDHGQKGKGEDHRKKVAGKRDDLKRTEDEQCEKERKRDRATKFAGPYVYDAVSGEVSGEAPVVGVTDGSYRRVEFKLKRNFTAEESDPLLGNVFVIHGTVKQGEAEVPFEIEWHHAMNFRLRGEKAFAVAAGENRLAIVFDMPRWFDGVDLAKAKADEDGTIRINKHSHRELLKQLRRNIKKATRFGKDADHDGVLTPDETAGAGDETAADDDKDD